VTPPRRIPGVVGFAIGLHPKDRVLCIVVIVRSDPDRTRQEHPLLAQPQFHLTKLSKNEITKPFIQESIGNSGLSIYSDVAPAAIGRTMGSICLVGDPTRLESEGEEERDVEESEEDEDEDGDEKELQALWLQVLTSADVRLGAKSKSTYAQILARNGLCPSRINNAAADEKHPLLKSMGSPFDKAVHRLNLIEGLARAAQPKPNS
jgi:hypothetical protein